MAPTLYLALKGLIDLASSEASHVDLGLIERDRDVLIYTHYPVMKGEPGYTSSQTYQLGLIIDLVRHFLGHDRVPKEIGIEYPEVPRGVEELYPGVRILPRQRVGYLSVPRECLHVSSGRASRETSSEYSPVLTRDFDFAETLGALLHPYLPAGYPSAQLAASLVDTSVTTLARRLSECGTSYRSLVDRVRFEAARELLEDPDKRITDVAISVGFDDSSNFARMFRRIGGLSPREYRAVSLR
jgi:AraC-like DNA-binding protein